jgi:hypothetical protein
VGKYLFRLFIELDDATVRKFLFKRMVDYLTRLVMFDPDRRFWTAIASPPDVTGDDVLGAL